MPFRDIDRPPVTKEVHSWADYGELRCLHSPDGLIAIDQLFDIVHDVRDEREGLGDYETEDDSDGPSPDPLPTDMKREAWGSSVQRQWSFRARAFAGAYPFILEERGLRLKPAPRDDGQRIYLFLLFAGSGRYLSKPVHSRFTRAFERLSLHALRRYLPQPASCELFHREGPYSGNLYNRIQALAQGLGETCTARPQDFSNMNVGDGGLDIVALLKFGKPHDLGRGFLTAFGQCACSLEEWEEKQHSCDYNAWKQRIDLQVRPQPLVFIPFCYRQADGTWYSRDSIRVETILLDRVRIFGLLEGDEAEASASLPQEVDALMAAGA